MPPFRHLMALALLAATAACPLRAAEPPPAGIPIRFTLKEPGFVTLVVEDQDGMRVRNLLSETPFPAGERTVYWDGLDDRGRDVEAAKMGRYHVPGKVVAPGRYSVRGLVRPEIGLRYEFTPYTHGEPPWRSKDRSSEWLANHTPPSVVLFVPEKAAPKRDRPAPGGQVLVGSLVAEGGSGLAWLDLEGRKVHGQLWIGGVWTGATHLARDDGPKAVPGVYAYTASAWPGDKYNGFQDELRLHELLDPTVKRTAPTDTRFGTGEDRKVLDPTFKFPPGGSAKGGINGLAARDGVIVVSLPGLNRLLFVDAVARKVREERPLDDPRGVAFDARGRLLALSGRTLRRWEGTAFGPDLSGGRLEDPQQLALDADGNVYVSDWGASHQVKVFAPDGRFLRAVGTPGVPGVGPYDPGHMNHPRGLTISGDGRLWVAEEEHLPKRVSVWTPDGKLVKALYGPQRYGGGGTVDPLDPSRFFYAEEGGAMELRLDWEKGTSVPVAVTYRLDRDRTGLPVGYRKGAGPQTPLHRDGVTYLTNCFNSSPTSGSRNAVLWRLRDGVAVPCAAVGQAADWPALGCGTPFAVRWTGTVTPKVNDTCTFVVTNAAGVRLTVGGERVIDVWGEKRRQETIGTATLTAGKAYPITLELAFTGYEANPGLTWFGKAPGNTQRTPVRADAGFRVEFFADRNLKGAGVTDTKPVPVIAARWENQLPPALRTEAMQALRQRLPAKTDLAKDSILLAWSDLNGDGLIQPEEVTALAGDVIGVTVAPDFTVLTATGLRLRPASFTPGGAPVYDAAKAETLLPGTQRPTSSGGGQALLGTNDDLVLTVAPKPFAPQSVGGGRSGKATWSYPSLWPGLHASHNAPLPEYPGELLGTTRLLGPLFRPPGCDAELWAVNGNLGNVYLFTADGLFVATLFRDGRRASWSMPEAKRGMALDDVSLSTESFWPTLTQTADGRVLLQGNGSLVRVEGLDRIRRLPAQTIEVTVEQLAESRRRALEDEAARQQKKELPPLVVALRKQPPAVDGKLADWPAKAFVTIDERTLQVGDWGHRKLKTAAALAVSGDCLYGAFRLDAADGLANAGGSMPLLFKSGGALDLMIGTAPTADPKRTAAAAGDVRLLFAQVKGKTVAVLYRPVASRARGGRDPVAFGSPLRTIYFDRVEDVSEHVRLATGMLVLDEKKQTGLKDAVVEFSIPLRVLGLEPRPGLTLRGDVGVLRGNGFETLQRVYWSNKATGLTADVPSEAELTPRLWGAWRFEEAP